LWIRGYLESRRLLERVALLEVITVLQIFGPSEHEIFTRVGDFVKVGNY